MGSNLGEPKLDSLFVNNWCELNMKGWRKPYQFLFFLLNHIKAPLKGEIVVKLRVLANWKLTQKREHGF